MRSILLYLTGHAPEPIARRHGVFAQWFRRLFANGPRSGDFTVVDFDGTEPSTPPDPRDFAGIVMTGSPASLTEPEHWMEGAVETIREAHGSGTPLLGVCFGHQLIGAAFGAAVVENPRGWEVATHEVSVHENGHRDPLLTGVGDRLRVNLSHRDIVDADTISPLNGLRILAGNSKTDAQVIAGGDHIRGVQFHPEFDGDIVSAYVQHRYDQIADDANARDASDDHPDALLARAADCPDSERVFHNFVEHFVFKS